MELDSHFQIVHTMEEVTTFGGLFCCDHLPSSLEVGPCSISIECVALSLHIIFCLCCPHIGSAQSRPPFPSRLDVSLLARLQFHGPIDIATYLVSGFYPLFELAAALPPPAPPQLCRGA